MAICTPLIVLGNISYIQEEFAQLNKLISVIVGCGLLYIPVACMISLYHTIKYRFQSKTYLALNLPFDLRERIVLCGTGLGLTLLPLIPLQYFDRWGVWGVGLLVYFLTVGCSVILTGVLYFGEGFSVKDQFLETEVSGVRLAFADIHSIQLSGKQELNLMSKDGLILSMQIRPSECEKVASFFLAHGLPYEQVS